jgi:hypothetical protein
MIKCYSTCNYFHLMTVVFQNDFPKMHSVNRSLINDLHQPYFVHVSKKNSTGKGKPPSPTLPGADTQGAHNPLMA